MTYQTEYIPKTSTHKVTLRLSLKDLRRMFNNYNETPGSRVTKDQLSKWFAMIIESTVQDYDYDPNMKGYKP